MIRFKAISFQYSPIWLNTDEEKQMARVDFIKLTNSDLERVIDLLQEIVTYKSKSLTLANWAAFETDYLPKAIAAIRDNSFKVVDPHNSIVTWIIDQAVHSRLVVDGIPKRDWIPLIDIERFQNTLSMLRAAAKGHTAYHTYATTNNKFGDLFQ
jgi:hypothetical protein